MSLAFQFGQPAMASARRFGPDRMAARRTETVDLQSELCALRQSNDELAGQSPSQTLDQLIDGLNRTVLEENGRKIRSNLARMSIIYNRLEELRRIGLA